MNLFKNNERALKVANDARIAVLEMALNCCMHGMMVTDVAGNVQLYNQRLLQMWKLSDGVFERDQSSWKSQMAYKLKDPTRLIVFFDRVMDQPVQETLDIFEMGDGRLIECHSSLQYLEQYNQTYRVWNFTDCTEQHRREKELQHISMHDTLTGVHNRAYFDSALRHARLNSCFPVSMIMVDVDGLKKVNDHQGHQAGDTLLRHTAIILRQACRVEDTVARLGGDEFGILLANAGQEVAKQVADRIVGLENVHNIRHPDLPISLSLGIAVAYDEIALQDLFIRADEIMYQNRAVRKAQAAAAESERTKRKDASS